MAVVSEEEGRETEQSNAASSCAHTIMLALEQHKLLMSRLPSENCNFEANDQHPL